MPPPAAIGFRAHSGWAAAVAIVQAAGGPSEAPVVVARRRIEMRERGASGPSQPYHAAVGLDIREARRHVEACEAHAAARATNELRGMLEDLRQLGHPVAGCGLLLGSGRPLPALEKILASHPLLHTAEGELFREALRAASQACRLPVTQVKEHDLHTRVVSESRLQGRDLAQLMTGLGKALGPPWGMDQKHAAMAAWLALGRR
jgi:hypothetical protein